MEQGVAGAGVERDGPLADATATDRAGGSPRGWWRRPCAVRHAHTLIHQARGTRTAVRGMGFISGAYGYVYTEYKRSGPAPVDIG